MERNCLFPGTFDPFTIGHVDIVTRALPLFDKMIIGVGINSNKKPMFPVEKRVDWIREIYRHEPKIEIVAYEGLTISYCKKMGINFILRGIRFVSDFEYEKAIADMNRLLEPGIETFFLTCSPQYSSVSSTLVRDVLRFGGDVRQFLPHEVDIDYLLKDNR